MGLSYWAIIRSGTVLKRYFTYFVNFEGLKGERAQANGSITTGMPQQEVESDMQPLENDATAAQQTASSAQSKYTRFWKGSLTELRQGQRVLITKLECSRSSSASKTLTTNWPSDMQIVRLISQERMTIHKQHARKEDLLVFRPVNPGRSLSHLKEKKLGAVIQLPSQTLLLFVSEKPNQLIGMFIPQVTYSR
ncbi:hypothetical protein MTR_7g077950 [Medicago truncatula]|uniref:Uncharacterized protein n=1 Tax=Medicago truncatula TaxID=3880 RepID=G7L4Q7_MEDTR|nr:hypothetical protein MTR_7g077950 [Medicago truncatula]